MSKSAKITDFHTFSRKSHFSVETLSPAEYQEKPREYLWFRGPFCPETRKSPENVEFHSFWGSCVKMLILPKLVLFELFLWIFTDFGVNLSLTLNKHQFKAQFVARMEPSDDNSAFSRIHNFCGKVRFP